MTPLAYITVVHMVDKDYFIKTYDILGLKPSEEMTNIVHVYVYGIYGSTVHG